MALSGHADGPPMLPQRNFGAALLELLDEVRALTGVDLDRRIFTMRAAELGLTRGGGRSANRTCQMLRASDGWIALNVARPEDREALDAWLELDGVTAPLLPELIVGRSSDALVARGRLLSMPVARVGAVALPPVALPAPYEWPPASRRPPPLVLDMSSLWAGPLCAHILGLAGARVIKVESRVRLDGARLGPRRFYDALHAGHESVVLDLASEDGRAALWRLAQRADILIESSRPRALDAFGLSPERVRAVNPPQVRVSITAYGRAVDAVGFGDDVAAAAGLICQDDRGQPVFAGDALADPITGLVAACEASRSYAAGDGGLLDIAMAGCAARIAAAPALSHGIALNAAPPSLGPGAVAAAEPGRDTAKVLAEFCV